jgi:hypothetical protein
LQDKIISFCALTYAILFTAAFNHPKVVLPYALASLAVTVGGECMPQWCMHATQFTVR